MLGQDGGRPPHGQHATARGFIHHKAGWLHMTISSFT